MKAGKTQLPQSDENYLKIIADFSIALSRQTTLDEVVWEMSRYVSRTLGFYDCIIYLYDEKKKELVQKSAFGPKNPVPFKIKEPITMALGVGIVGFVAKSLKAEIVNDTSKDPRYIVDDEVRLSEITIPIVYEGKLIGIIDSEHPEKDFYTNDQLEILNLIASMSATKIMQSIVFDHLQIQTEKLKILNDRLLQFAYVTSHDLRSPVNNIVTLLSFLDYKSLEGENHTILENINKASQKLQENLQNLIELVIDESSIYEKIEIIDFAKLLEEVKLSIGKQIDISEAVIESEFRVENIQYPYVYLHSIVLNLITNGIKYKSSKRPPVILLKTKLHENYICLSVKDNGRGIDLEKNRFKIFSRLERFDKDVEGTGLGLYLVKSQVEALGGKIEVESKIGKGTEFNVFLLSNLKKGV